MTWKASLLTLLLVLALAGCGPSPDDPDYQLCDVLAVGGTDALDEAASLIERGADVNRQFPSEGNATCLTALASANFPAGVELLLEYGADPNIEARNGDTALLFAASNGREENVRLLIEHGANVNHRSTEGRTAFAAASEGGYEAIVELLRAAGATE